MNIFYMMETLVSIVNEFKYLGIIFKPSGTIFCIRKSLCSENMNVVLQETNLPLRSRGSQSFPKLSAKSLIYKEKIVGIKIQPCFTPILDLTVSDKFT
jgi:hypothetical protein